MQVRGPLTTAANSLMRSTVAVGQLTSTGDRAKNLDICQGLIRQAKERGAQMLFLPECFSFIGSKWQETVAAGQSLTVEHGVVDIMAKYAKEYNLWLSLGGFNEKTMDGQEKVFNSHIIIDADGLTRAVYRKIHLFDVEVPNGPVLMESRYTAPGSQIVAVDSPVGRLGLSTCYDLRFVAFSSFVPFVCLSVCVASFFGGHFHHHYRVFRGISYSPVWMDAYSSCKSQGFRSYTPDW